MSKNSHFTGPFDKQHGKWPKALLKSEWQQLYHIYWSLRRKLSWKKSLLVICKILTLFVNTLTADGKYSLINRDNLTHPIQMQLSQKQKGFTPIFYAFLKSILYFEHFNKKRILIADVFQKLCTPKNVVTQMSKKSCFRGHLNKEHGKPAQTLLKSKRQHLYHIYSSLWRWLSWKKPLLVKCKILRQFVNTLTADDKYSLLNRDNLTQPIQMQLSQKQKTFFTNC